MKNEQHDFNRLIAEVVQNQKEPQLSEKFTVDMMNRVYQYQNNTRYRWLYILVPLMVILVGTGVYYLMAQNWFFLLLDQVETWFTMKRTFVLLGGAAVYLLSSRILVGILVLRRQISY